MGAERSGTTLLRVMLDSNPRVHCISEVDYLFSDEAIPYDALQAKKRLLEERIFVDRGVPFDELLDRDGHIRNHLEVLRSRQGKEIFGVTVHLAYPSLRRMWPEAKYIHIVRDPRAVAHSCVGMGWVGNVWRGVERWIAAERSWDEAIKEVPQRLRLEIRYEDLVREPHRELRRACEFLNVGFAERMLSYPSRSSYAAPDAKRIDSWKKKLSPNQMQWVELRSEDLMLSRHYQLSASKIRLNFWQVLYLRIQDAAVRHRFRIRRFGIYLYGIELLNRRVLFGLVGKWLWPRLHKIEAKYLD